MKVVLIGPAYPYRGGISHYTTMLHIALKEHGHDAALVSFRRLYPNWLFPGESDKDPSQEPLKTDNVHECVDSLNPVSWLLTAAWIMRRKPDIVIFSWWTTFLMPAWYTIAALLRLLVRVPLVYICHNVLPHEARPRDRWAARLVLGTGTGYIVQSDSQRELLRSLIARAEPVVVPTPVFDMFSLNLPPKALARQRLGLRPDVPVLLFFGIVREYKGLSDLLGAMPEIRSRLGDVHLVIAGEFWEPRQRYDRLIHELGIEDSVTIEDRYILNEEVPLYFGAADLVIAPHRRATGSGVVQMAIGFGVPLVTTLAEHFRDVDCSGSCVVVAPNDIAALSAAVVDYFTCPSPAPRHHNAQRLAEVFSWRRLVVALEGFADGGGG